MYAYLNELLIVARGDSKFGFQMISNARPVFTAVLPTVVRIFHGQQLGKLLGGGGGIEEALRDIAVVSGQLLLRFGAKGAGLLVAVHLIEPRQGAHLRRLRPDRPGG